MRHSEGPSASGAPVGVGFRPPSRGRTSGGRAARASAPETLAKHAPDPVPALLVGRLAVDRHHAGGGLGNALVALVLATAVELNASAACRAVVVTALNEHARAWWERLGFSPFDPDDPSALDTFLEQGLTMVRATT